MKGKNIAAWILIAAALLSLWGCRKNGHDSAPETNEEITDPNILTHVWRETARTDEQFKMTYGFLPYLDRESKTLICLAQTSEDTDGENEIFWYSVIRLSEDGESEAASFLLTNEWIFGGFADRDGLTCSIYSQDENGNRRGVIGRYDFASGAWTRTDDVLSLFSSRAYGMRGPVGDAAGDYVVAHETDLEILVLSGDGKLIRSIRPEKGSCNISKLVTSEDGRIFASLVRNNGGNAVAEVFPDEGKIGDLMTGGDALFGGNACRLLGLKV